MSQALIFFEMTSMKLMEMDSTVSISELLSSSKIKPSKKESVPLVTSNTKEKINNKEEVKINTSKNVAIDTTDKVDNKLLSIDNIINEWKKFIVMISKERPSIGTALEHSSPTSLVGSKLIIEVSGLPDFSVGNLNRNNQVIESFLKDYFKIDLKIEAMKGEAKSNLTKPETNININKLNNDQINSKNDESDNVVSRVIEVFDGEILR
jgi:hypothetical protein